jgi:ribosomal protein S18 acetylase RimI-like enzyme
MTFVRIMRPDDADAVREVDAIAFYAWAKGLHGESTELQQRTRDNVLACLEKDPEGCFVAEEQGRVVGFILSRTWGGVGWPGTFAVLPEFQGRGLGKELLLLSLEYLRRGPGRIIGLETMANSPGNLGLYLKQGFQMRFPIILLQKEFQPDLEQPSAQVPELLHWSTADPGTQERWLTELREASGQIMPGLDYSKEITSTARHGLGETLVLMDGAKAVGMSSLELVSRIEGWGQDWAVVQVLALHPDHTNAETLLHLLSGSESLARAHHKTRLMVAVNGRHAWALRRLLVWGYRVRRAGIHMILEGTDEGPAADCYANLVRWAA